MAYLKASEIVIRARELVEDAEGTVRAIAAARFAGALHDGVPEDELSRLGLLDAKPAEARITAVRAHPQRLTRVGNVNLIEFDLEVRVVRTVNIHGQVDDDTRDAVNALAAIDADALNQAFGWPNNLAQTAASATTDWIAAEYEDTAIELNGEAGSDMRFDTVHRFVCTARTRPATT